MGGPHGCAGRGGGRDARGRPHWARIACWLNGQGFAWTSRTQLFSATGGIIAGDASAGLSRNAVGITTSDLAWSIAFVELVSLGAAAWLVHAVLVRWGPLAIKGVAAAGEAERLLGLSRLRRVRRVIRPDLYRRGSRDKGLLPGGTAS